MGITGATQGARRAIVLAAVVAVGLAGCASGERDPIPNATASSTPDVSVSPSDPEPDTNESPDEAGSPSTDSINSNSIALSCGQLLDPQTVYDYNPNVGTDPGYRATSAASRALDWQGVACGLLNQTSGETFSIAVADFAADSAQTARDELTPGSASASGVPGDAYFRSSGGTGRVDVFVDTYWIVAESAAFFEARDAAGLINGVIDALP